MPFVVRSYYNHGASIHFYHLKLFISVWFYHAAITNVLYLHKNVFSVISRREYEPKRYLEECHRSIWNLKIHIKLLGKYIYIFTIFNTFLRLGRIISWHIAHFYQHLDHFWTLWGYKWSGNGFGRASSVYKDPTLILCDFRKIDFCLF